MIKIENLTKSYRTPTGRHYVFKDLNIEILQEKALPLLVVMVRVNQRY